MIRRMPNCPFCLFALFLGSLAGCDNPKDRQKAADQGAQWERRRVLRILDDAIGKRIAAGDIAAAKLLSGVRSQAASDKEINP